jgi:hypothetical protein
MHAEVMVAMVMRGGNGDVRVVTEMTDDLL